MFYVAGENLVPLLVALLIGFVTGLWIWKLARRPAAAPERVLKDDAPLRRPYVDNRPDENRPIRNRGAEVEPETFATPRPEPEVLARRAPSPAYAPVPDDARPREVAEGGTAGQPDADGGEAGDDLQAMKGLGPKLASLLRREGITRYAQIAALTADDLARLDAHLGAFRGRLARDRIVEQAGFLARGDREGYEREFGRL